jgi:hypothetical protein
VLGVAQAVTALRRGEPGWAAGSVGAGVGMFGAFALAGAGFSQQPRFARWGGLWQRIALTIGFGYLSALAARARRCARTRSARSTSASTASSPASDQVQLDQPGQPRTLRTHRDALAQAVGSLCRHHRVCASAPALGEPGNWRARRSGPAPVCARRPEPQPPQVSGNIRARRSARVVWGDWVTLDELRALLADPVGWPFVPDGRVGISCWFAPRGRPLAEPTLG